MSCLIVWRKNKDLLLLLFIIIWIENYSTLTVNATPDIKFSYRVKKFLCAGWNFPLNFLEVYTYWKFIFVEGGANLLIISWVVYHCATSAIKFHKIFKPVQSMSNISIVGLPALVDALDVNSNLLLLMHMLFLSSMILPLAMLLLVLWYIAGVSSSPTLSQMKSVIPMYAW